MDRLLASWTYLSALDAALAQLCNRASRPALARALFAAISRLGDGMAWYLTMAALPLAYGYGVGSGDVGEELGVIAAFGEPARLAAQQQSRHTIRLRVV